MKARIARSVVKVPPREPDRRDTDHRKMVSYLPCLICGLRAGHGYLNDPHHLQRGLDPKERGMGRKASDRWLVPLCREHHRWAEATGDDEAQLTSAGIDGRALAAALWAARGDDEAMRRIVERSLLARRVYG
jgi:hypothetical protein